MSTSFGLWLVEKLQNPITEPEFRASAKGTISYYGLELDLWKILLHRSSGLTISSAAQQQIRKATFFRSTGLEKFDS